LNDLNSEKQKQTGSESKFNAAQLKGISGGTLA
jgi:hypothetical protein